RFLSPSINFCPLDDFAGKLKKCPHNTKAIGGYSEYPSNIILNLPYKSGVIDSKTNFFLDKSYLILGTSNTSMTFNTVSAFFNVLGFIHSCIASCKFSIVTILAYNMLEKIEKNQLYKKCVRNVHTLKLQVRIMK
ncbi:unnamed protein product, partial [Heterotrigona itama]